MLLGPGCMGVVRLKEVKNAFPYRWSWALLGLLLAQAILGLVWSDAYRDVDWIRATWYGNDWVTLVAAAPLLVAGMLLTKRGSAVGVLLWLGVLGYAVYNYAFYMVGAALNVFFPLYAAILVLSVANLILVLTRLDPAEVKDHFRPRTPVRTIGGFYIFLGLGLSVVWLGMWAAYVFGARPPPVGSEVFKVVAGFDMTLMVPVLGVGGVLLWRRHPWGYVVAPLAGIQAMLYLFVLAVNAGVLAARGVTHAVAADAAKPACPAGALDGAAPARGC